MPQILMPYTVHLDHTLRVTPMNTLFAKGDSAAHRFELTILRAGVQDELTGCTVMYKFYRMADSMVVSEPGSVEDGKAVAVLDAACYDYIGRFALTIAIKKGDEETTVFYGDGYMHGQNADTSISGEYIIYDINTLLEKISEIDAATQAANTATSNANTATTNANTASGKANTAANAANTAATNANTAKDAANAAAGKINNMTVSATPVATGMATAELSTVDGHYHLALGLPKGDTGATPQISVQVQTGAAGSEASVSVSGTAENPVIHLTIPRGDVGNISALTINGKAPDGSGAVMLTAEDVGALAAGGTAADSSKLGGVAASDYALKTDTAPDSSKLGGKAPEYYIQPRNLLDNSDFTNPVNQRGITSETSVPAYSYFLDRWINQSSEARSFTLSMSGIGLPLVTTLLQKIEKIEAGKIVTFAIKLSDGTIATLTGTVQYTSDGSWTRFASISHSFGDMYMETMNGFVNVVVYNTEIITIEWAALYEGSYTADTLPPYVPKGYAAELAECQRYYFRWIPTYTASALGFAVNWTGTSARAVIYLPSPMRNQGTLPTISFKNLKISYRSSNTNIKLSDASVMSEGGNIIHIGLTIDSGTVGEVGYLVADDTVDSYVELSKDL